MCRWVEALILVAGLASAAGFADADNYPGIGREATPAEVAAWDIDVRADFLGLPEGSGSVSLGAEIFSAKCAHCHGGAGELSGGTIMAPLIGGTSASDIEEGQVKALLDTPPVPRTLFMKLATLSSLFDYISRAMPWTEPKSLSADEVYASVAYLLHLADIVPADFVLSFDNISAVQAMLPNRNGMTTDHGLWPGASASEGGMGNGGIPDVLSSACMFDCVQENNR
mgnify:CR=1 FL=1